MNYQDIRSLPELVGSLVTDSSDLIRKEIQLAKAEAGEKLSRMAGGGQVLVIGAVLGLIAAGTFVAAATMALGLAFEVWAGLSATAANCLGAAIMAAILTIAALGFLARGRAALKGSNLKFTRTTASLERDAAVVKETL